jgi:DNA-directed RNA polymerase sigma subunit (sigma70/sigma32)
MPGFIKDENVDERLLDGKRRRGVVVGPYHQQRVSPPPSSALQRRPTARMVRPNASGTDKSIAKLKRSVRRRQANSESMYRNSATVPDSLLDYARDFHAVSRVTPREEVELGTRTQEAERLRRLHVVLQSRYGRDPTDDEWCAAAGKVNALALREAIEDGLEAKNQLVASNLRMVQRVVNLYIRNGLGSEYNAGDLMQDGTMVCFR